ncbi:unnamed protein product [Notodromas monacha]|uniref:Phosphoenolpyruvate synthase n=1 Tax=Notodromas monacha TaxID=399045 RepID=A0A7R9GEN9_9CRUS|nr:unnamed protein product [Notodromas monacha]CAG0919840.1 unnamed protein product [Notodromas monacha]
MAAAAAAAASAAALAEKVVVKDKVICRGSAPRIFVEGGGCKLLFSSVTPEAKHSSELLSVEEGVLADEPSPAVTAISVSEVVTTTPTPGEVFPSSSPSSDFTTAASSSMASLATTWKIQEVTVPSISTLIPIVSFEGECWDKSFIIESNTWMRPIEKLSLSLPYFGEHEPWVRSKQTFTCTDGPKSHTLTLEVGQELYRTISEFPESSQTIVTKIFCTMGKVRGNGMAMFTYGQPPVGQFMVAHPLVVKRQLVQLPARAVLGLANPQPTKLWFGHPIVWVPKQSGDKNHAVFFRIQEPENVGKSWTIANPISPKEWQIASAQWKICVSFDSAACAIPSLVGGKGASLAVLTRLHKQNPDQKFKVAKGFCVTVVGYEQQLDHSPEIRKVLQELQSSISDEDHLKSSCSRAEAAIGKASLDPKIAGAITAAFIELFGLDWETRSYALRSSGVGEDSDEASSAGQNETFLGVTGFQNVSQSLLKCWASQFAFRSVLYRKQNGIPILPPMAVVVQEMVRAEAAGVLFTCDPVTGNPAMLHISANLGLGETVVSGEVEPDTIVISRNPVDGSLSVTDVEIGQKSLQMYLNDEGTLVEVSSEPEDSSRSQTPSISDEVALSLANLGIFLEDTMGGARDLEWALSQASLFPDGDIYLLQSRPVTTVHAITEFELTHEFDSGFLTDHEFSTRGNTGEVLPGALTPFSLTTGSKILDNTMQQLSENLSRITLRSTDGFCPLFNVHRLAVSSHSVIFLNLLELFLRDHKSREVQPDTAANMIGTFGKVFEELDEMQEIADDRYVAMNKLQIFFRLIWFIQARNTPEFCNNRRGLLRGNRHASNAERLRAQLHLEVSPTSSADDIERTLCKAVDALSQGGMLHISVSGLSLFAEVLMVLTLNGDKKKVEMSPELISDVATLLGMQQDGVISREVPETFRDIADLIRGTEKEQEFLQLSPKDADAWLRNQGGQLEYRYKQFFERHGHRGLREFETHSKPWGMTPELVAETLQVSVRTHSPVQNNKNNAPNTPDEIVQALKTDLTGGKKRFMKLLVLMGARGVRQREATKSAIIGLGHKLRLVLRDITQWLLARGRIPDDDLTCFLTMYELVRLLRQPCPLSVQRALRRRKMHPILDALQFPELCKGFPQPLPQETETIQPDLSVDFSVSGTPVCHGQVKGPIRVVKTLAEAKNIVPGDILVTHSTDIGWSPYFPILGGLVTEIGGLISHGAVVAREYGLPCVVGVKNATKYFEQGDIGLLDGSKGILVRLAKA